MSEIKNYALVNASTNTVENIILWDGISDFKYPDGFLLIEATEGTPISIGYSYEDSGFIAPEPLPPTEEELEKIKQVKISINVEKKKQLMEEATQMVATLQDAVDLEMATQEETDLLLSWKKYRVLLNRINSEAEEVEWPTRPD